MRIICVIILDRAVGFNGDGLRRLECELGGWPIAVTMAAAGGDFTSRVTWDARSLFCRQLPFLFPLICEMQCKGEREIRAWKFPLVCEMLQCKGKEKYVHGRLP